MENKKLTKEQYFEFLATVEQLKNADLELKIKALDFQLANEKLSHAKTHEKLCAVLMREQKGKYLEVKNSYDTYIKQLEEEIGTEIKNKGINPYTFEVMELDKMKE